MKRIISGIMALTLTFCVYGTVFAQTVNDGVGYNVVVNGVAGVFAPGDAINVDGVSMFTADCLVNKFSEAGLTAEGIAVSAKAFSYNGQSYYSLREAAAGNGLNVFWDAATRTALVINKDKYEKIKSLIEATGAQESDIKKVEMEINGMFGIAVIGFDELGNMEIPIDAKIKLDIESPFMELLLKTAVEDTVVDMHMYDDGEETFLNSGDGWYVTDSSLGESKQVFAQMQAISPTQNALAEDLSIAGLKLTQSGEEYTLEGDMYTSETFKDIDIQSIMEEIGADTQGLSYDYAWPQTIYVKYVMDGSGNIKSMSVKFEMGVSIAVDEETSIEILITADLNVPKYVIDGDFETTVPQEVKDAADDYSDVMTVPVEPAA